MDVDIDKYPYELIHGGDDKHNGGCGGVAFYLTTKLAAGDYLRASIVSWVNGVKAVAEEPIVCGSCGNPIELKGMFVEDIKERRVHG